MKVGINLIINGGAKKDEMIRKIHNKRYIDLSSNLKRFIKKMYPEIRDNDLITCQKLNGRNIDFSTTVNKVTKIVSIKTGNTCFVYNDRITELILFLSTLNVKSEVLLAILEYHYADGTYDGSGECKLFGDLLKQEYAGQIELVRKEFEDKELLSKVIDHVLLIDKVGNKIDYFYYGNLEYGFTVSAKVVKEQLLNRTDNFKHDFMRIGPFNLLPFKREINYTEKSNRKHYCYLKLNNFYKFTQE